MDRNLKILSVNRAFREWLNQLNYDVSLKGRHISEVFSFLPPRVIDEYEQVFETGEVLITSEVTLFEGREIFTEVRKIPVFKNGDVVRIVTIIRDVTEQRLLETTFEDYNRQFTSYRATSEERFSSIFNESPVSICVFDGDGILTHANPACATMFGLTRCHDLLGLDIFRTPDIPDGIIEKIRKGERIDFEWVLDIDHFARTRNYETSKTGTMQIGTIVSPIHSEDQLRGWIVQMQDITRWKQAQQELQKTRDIALEFLDIMSHDISNYMQSILMCSGLLSEVAKDAGKGHILGMMDEAIFDCIEMIKQARRSTKDMTEKPV
jgi:PAS domain S-box-containing protein